MHTQIQDGFEYVSLLPSGKTLRDEFAMAAIPSLVLKVESFHPGWQEWVTGHAYRMADFALDFRSFGHASPTPASPDLQGELVAACRAFFAADHYDHFATRVSVVELEAIERMRAILAKLPAEQKPE